MPSATGISGKFLPNATGAAEDLGLTMAIEFKWAVQCGVAAGLAEAVRLHTTALNGSRIRLRML